jgi:hypothetical protein
VVTKTDENAFNNIITTKNITLDNNLSKSIGVCLYPRVDNNIIEQGVEELLDSNAETIDPKKEWIKKWQVFLKSERQSMKEQQHLLVMSLEYGLRHV